MYANTLMVIEKFGEGRGGCFKSNKKLANFFTVPMTISIHVIRKF